MEKMPGKTSIDEKQKLRMRRFFMACRAYTMWFSLLAICKWLGYLRLSWAGAIFLIFIALLVNFFFYRLFATGKNLRFSDPSLTLPQMAAATILAMAAVYFTNQIRPLILLIYFTTFTFGMFKFSRETYLSFTLFTIVSYCIAMGLLILNHPETIDPVYESLQFVIFVTVLFWFAVIGSYISDLRRRLALANSELKQALSTIENLAIKDDLTNAYNRRYLFSELSRVKKLADQKQTFFSVIMFDIDGFKRVNDILGLKAGDEILKQLVHRISQYLEKQHILARVGGEEFVILMPGTDLQEAAKAAEQIRKGVEDLNFPGLPPGLKITISVGVSAYISPESIDVLMARTDTALHQAKAMGCNRVEAATLPEDPYRS